MVKINGKEVIFSTSFIMQAGESAAIAPAELLGSSLRLNAVEKDVNLSDPERDVEVAANGQELALTFPFLKNGLNNSMELRDYANMQAGKLYFRIAMQSVGIAMLVHLDVHFVNNP
jgi:hypothetical protein